MINTVVSLAEIRYETVPVEAAFLDSIRQRGVAIPVRVNVTEHGYACVDGRKRLSACAILAKQDPRFARIPVLLMNDYRKAGSSFWGNTKKLH